MKIHDAKEPEVLVSTSDVGNLEVLTIDDLHVDHTYQRDLSADRVQSIAAKWDIVAAGPIVVSRRANGDLYIVNGQHRAAAAKMAGETHVIAQVVNDLTAKQEATLRLKGNYRLGDKAMERFRAQLAAEDPESKAIVTLCEQFETRINATPSTEHGINAITAVETMYRRNKGILLTRVFEVIRLAFGRVEGKYATVGMMKGIEWMLEKHHDGLDRGRFVDRLAAEGPEGLERKARSHKAAMGGALWTNYYRAMVEAYNHRLPEGSRLEWRTGGWSKERESGFLR